MFFRHSGQNGTTIDGTASHGTGNNPASVRGRISLNLEDNLTYIADELGHSPDVVIRRFELGVNKTMACAVYTDGITDKQKVELILHSLIAGASVNLAEEQSLPEFINTHSLAIGEVHLFKDWDSVILAVLSGCTVIFIEGVSEAISGATKGGEYRAIEEPSTQVVIRGPKEGFTESIGTNVSLVRRRIKSPNIRLEAYKIGSHSQTNVAIMYMKGAVKQQDVDELKRRLAQIRIEALSGSEELERKIVDQRFTPFPTVLNTERPDTVSHHLLKGRISIFVDGTPFVLITPTTFFMGFESAEDYYQRPEATIAIRMLRYASLIVALFVPSIYIAAITFHQEMIPTPLLLSVANQRESVPFPAFLEAFLMEITFEVIREAGIRMPRAIGQAVSIVGALVLGQAAVEAGIISSAMVIVVAITGISSFANPSYNTATSIRIIRFSMMVAAAMLGFYGIAIFSIFLIGHMCGLTSLGVPYMSLKLPYTPEGERQTLYGIPLQSGAAKNESGSGANQAGSQMPAEELLATTVSGPERNGSESG